MDIKHCTVLECDKTAYGNTGLCNTHYIRKRRHGSTDKPAGRPPNFCNMQGCEERVSARGLCVLHYQRARISGEPLAADKHGREYVFGSCSVSGCGRPAYKDCECHAHYSRRQKRTRGAVPLPSTTDVIRYKAPNRQGRTISNQGYVTVWAAEHPNARANGQISEHRLVMSQHLGRPLAEGENVHHLDGNRQNNAIENLQLWVKPPTRGVNIEDEILRCREFLAKHDKQ